MAPYLKFCLSFFYGSFSFITSFLCSTSKRALSLSSSSPLYIKLKKKEKTSLRAHKIKKHGQKNNNRGHRDWSKGIKVCPSWLKIGWREKVDLYWDLGIRHRDREVSEQKKQLFVLQREGKMQVQGECEIRYTHAWEKKLWLWRQKKSALLFSEG